jgi:hypothetical protein
MNSYGNLNLQIARLLGISAEHVYKFTVTCEAGEQPKVTLWQWLPPLTRGHNTEVNYTIVPLPATSTPSSSQKAALPQTTKEEPLVWPDLECVHDWFSGQAFANAPKKRTCFYCKKTELIT